MDVIASKVDSGDTNNAGDNIKYDQQHNDAAAIVQRAWRGHSMRKQKLSSDARWKDTVLQARMKVNAYLCLLYSSIIIDASGYAWWLR
jgi:hypothetical protein